MIFCCFVFWGAEEYCVNVFQMLQEELHCCVLYGVSPFLFYFFCLNDHALWQTSSYKATKWIPLKELVRSALWQFVLYFILAETGQCRRDLNIKATVCYAVSSKRVECCWFRRNIRTLLLFQTESNGWINILWSQFNIFHKNTIFRPLQI